MTVAAIGGGRKSVLGRYGLDRELTSDFLGRLWAARVDRGPQAGSFVTIRRLIQTDSFCRNALDELADAARSTMNLDPTRFIALTDVVRDDEELGIVFPRLDGMTLRALLRNAATSARPIGECVAACIVSDVAEQCTILSATRDSEYRYAFGGLTPESIFVDRTGRARLLDLGVAAVAARQALVRRHIAGASYFAPEQLDGSSTARTDVFALGLLVWEMLAIRRPRYAPTFRALSERIRFGAIAHLSRVVRPAAPPVAYSVADVVARALDPLPDRRFADPMEFAAALASVAEPVTHAEAALMLGLARASGIRRISYPPASNQRASMRPLRLDGYRDPLDTIPYDPENES